MRATELIAKKRDGDALSRDEIEFVVRGVTDGSLPDYQVAALLMAVVLRGMDDRETAWLTDAMARSGVVLDLSALQGPAVDKHSTGGVGDKTSLAIAPLVAACGAVVPMMSGRGLGHTGGTLDKIEAIPGLTTAIGPEAFRRQLEEIGCVIAGQTEAIAPADRRLYALRDVTATVPSTPLIVSSILSKKIAEGTRALVLDVKAGGGGFMPTLDAARQLASALVKSARRSGLAAEALVTYMDAPLGLKIGNTLEVVEVIELLGGRGPADLRDLVLRLASRMLVLAGLAVSDEEAVGAARQALGSGRALERFQRMVELQGGDPRVIDDPSQLPAAPGRLAVTAARKGYVVALDASLVGKASLALGAGRERVDAAIDPGAGIVLRARPGDLVDAGDELAELHYGALSREADAHAMMTRAFALGDAPPVMPPLILDHVKAAGEETQVSR